MDYYTRLEQGRAASMPSADVADALARALDLDEAERAHLHRLAGRTAPETSDGQVPAEGLLFILERLERTPAQIVTDLGAILAQNSEADSLFGWVAQAGPNGANVYERWFCHEEVREACPPENRAAYSEAQAGELRSAAARRELSGDHSGYEFVAELSRRSIEFKRAWSARRIHAGRNKHIWLPSNKEVVLEAHTTIDSRTSQRLVAFREVPLETVRAGDASVES